MMLSFKQLDNQFNNLCVCFIKLQDYFSSKKGVSTELKLSEIETDHNKINTIQIIGDTSPTIDKTPTTIITCNVSEIP